VFCTHVFTSIISGVFQNSFTEHTFVDTMKVIWRPHIEGTEILMSLLKFVFHDSLWPLVLLSFPIIMICVRGVLPGSKLLCLTTGLYAGYTAAFCVRRPPPPLQLWPLRLIGLTDLAAQWINVRLTFGPLFSPEDNDNDSEPM
jgi:hypothetical protein